MHVLSSPRVEGTPGLVLDWLTIDLPVDQYILFLRPGDNQQLEQFINLGQKVSIVDDLGSGFQRIRKIIRQTKLEAQSNRNLNQQVTLLRSNSTYKGNYLPNTFRQFS